MSKEVITKLERETGFVAIDPKDIPSTEDSGEFMQHALKGRFVGVNYEDRVKFLKANGYEVTRENLVNRELSVRQEEE